MSRLLTDEIRSTLPTFRTQEFAKDPTVYAVYFFPGSGWTWFVTEGQPGDDDFIFFGYVIGFEAEWGYFTLGELEELNICGVKVERVQNFKPTQISALKKQAADREV